MAETATQKDRRGALVRAAYNQIAGRGFEGLRTREVAAEAGVNIATLHYYFPTKEKLIEGVVEHAMERFRTTLAPHGSPSDQLRNHLRSVRRLVQDEPELGIVMGELALRSARDPGIARIMRETNEGWHRIVRGLLRRAVKEGNLRPEMNSDEVAAMVVATLRNLTLPMASSGPRGDQALRQLERWLGLGGSSRRRGGVQATD
jgi:AcrR family transcriptional regulator